MLAAANDSPTQRQLKEKKQLGGVEPATAVVRGQDVRSHLWLSHSRLLDATWHLDALARLCGASRTTGSERPRRRSSEREGVNSAAINKRPVKLPAGCDWVDAPFSQDVAHQTRLQDSACDSASIWGPLNAAASVDVLRASLIQGSFIKRKRHRIEFNQPANPAVRHKRQPSPQ